MPQAGAGARTRVGVVTFPGSTDAADTLRTLQRAGAEPVALAHRDVDLAGVAAVVLPGGVGAPSGDASAATSPIMGSIAAAARRGLPVLGIGHGFGLLCAAGLLPGALVANAGGTFLCRDERLRVDSIDTVWTCDAEPGGEVTLVLKSAAANYQADAATLARLEDERRVVLRYVANPTGSAHDIAGLTNAWGNVVGLAVQPEYAVDDLTGPSTDGRAVFTSVLRYLAALG